MLISMNLHKKSSEVSIKTKSPPVSLSFKGQATKHTTVKWSIAHKSSSMLLEICCPKISAIEAVMIRVYKLHALLISRVDCQLSHTL